MKRCLSQMCICGHHHCSHNYVRNILVPNPEKVSKKPSETSESFHAYPYKTPRPAIRPPRIAWTADDKPMISQPITRTDFKAYELGPKKPDLKSKYKPPSRPMFSESAYKESFCKGDREIQPVIESCRPHEEYVPPTQAMEKTTTSGVFFLPWDAEDREIVRGHSVKQIGNISIPKANMEGAKVGSKDSQAFNTDKRELGKSCGDAIYIWESIYKTDFVPKKPMLKPVPESMLPRRDNLKLPGFKGKSTYVHDFISPDFIPVTQYPSFRPDARYKEPEIDFEYRTKYRMDYPPWPLPAKKIYPWLPSKTYTKPTIPMTERSRYRESFCNPPEIEFPELRKVQAPMVPVEEQAAMQSDTSHKLAKSFAESRLYKAPTQKFANQIIYRSNYNSQFGLPSKPITLICNLATETGKMSNVTCHKKDDKPRTPVCPIRLLQTHGRDACPGIKFVGNVCGHEYYEKDNTAK